LSLAASRSTRSCWRQAARHRPESVEAWPGG
jgi:hypothetical protein